MTAMRRTKHTHQALYVAAFVGAVGAIAFFARQRMARAARVPPKPEAAPMPDTAPHTLSAEQLEALFGAMPWQPVAGDESAIRIDPAWKAANLVQVEIPQLQGVAGAPADRRVTVHRAIRSFWPNPEQAKPRATPPRPTRP